MVLSLMAASASVLGRAENGYPLSCASALPESNAAFLSSMTRSLAQLDNALNEAFFSVQNLNAIQQAIRQRIHASTGFTIDRQSDDQIALVMRSIYITWAENRADNIPQQVAALNERVLAECLPLVASGLKQYMAYLRDASTLPEPITRGVNTSVKGTVVLQSYPGF